jgi:hypothetical protein
MYKQAGDEQEHEMLSVVHSLLFSIHESELQAFIRGQCTGSCIRHLLVKLLRYAGYDAAVCVSKWQGFDKIPGGKPLSFMLYSRSLSCVTELFVVLSIR